MINDLPDAGTLTGLEFVAVLQDGIEVKTQIYKILAVTPATVTATPTAFTATGISETEIDLAWTGAGDNYILERSFDESSYNEIYSGATASFSDTGLYSDNEYWYRVKAQFTGQIDSEWIIISGTTLPPV